MHACMHNTLLVPGRMHVHDDVAFVNSTLRYENNSMFIQMSKYLSKCANAKQPIAAIILLAQQEVSGVDEP